MQLSVIVPATDSPPTLERCLAALRSAAAQDAGGAPATEVVVAERPAGAGPAAARNEGARRARGELLAFVDADVEVRGDALRAIRAAFEADPGLAAVFGSYDDDPEAGDAVSRFRNLLHHHVHARAAGPAETFWAGLGAVRRDAFEATGGFDADAFRRPSIEDIELGMRLRAAGARITLDPRIRGKHLKRWSLAEMAATDFARRGVPWVRLLLAAHRAPTGLNLGWRHRLAALAALAAAGGALGRRPRAAAAGLAALLVLDPSFYALLARRGGASALAAGIPLRALHHLLAAASVPAGVAAYLVGGPSGNRAPAGGSPAGVPGRGHGPRDRPHHPSFPGGLRTSPNRAWTHRSDHSRGALGEHGD